MEIHPCVLQDIGPLGPLSKKEKEKIPLYEKTLVISPFGAAAKKRRKFPYVRKHRLSASSGPLPKKGTDIHTDRHNLL